MRFIKCRKRIKVRIRPPLNWAQIVQVFKSFKTSGTVLNHLNVEPSSDARSALVIPTDFFYLALAHDFDRQRRRISLRLVVNESLIGFLKIS